MPASSPKQCDPSTRVVDRQTNTIRLAGATAGVTIVQLGRSFHGPRAFPDAYAPILGDPTGGGQPVETIRFQAKTRGAYRYECPVPGHAAMGMQGAFTVMA